MAELEKLAGEYTRQRQSSSADNDERLADLARKIVDSLSAPDFAFSLRDEALVSDGKTTYVYDNGEAYPKLYDFLSKILHVPVPLVINEAKFGPGEIIVNSDKKPEADAELRSAVKELQKLVHGKNAKVSQ